MADEIGLGALKLIGPLGCQLIDGRTLLGLGDGIVHPVAAIASVAKPFAIIDHEENRQQYHQGGDQSAAGGGRRSMRIVRRMVRVEMTLDATKADSYQRVGELTPNATLRLDAAIVLSRGEKGRWVCVRESWFSRRTATIHHQTVIQYYKSNDLLAADAFAPS